MLITVAYYELVTGDHDSADEAITARVEHATDLLAEALDRPVVQAERTERLWPDRAGNLWPRAVPIVAATGWTIDGHRLYGGFAPDETGAILVTYTGGWVERTANPDATNRVPAYVAEDLAWATHALLHPPEASTDVPAGATSVRLGDAAVTFGPDGPPRPGLTAIRWSRRTLSHRHQLARGA